MVTIRDDFLPIGINRPGTPFAQGFPLGLVQHSTATSGATAADIARYFHSPRDASCHLIVDWTEAVKIIPLSEIAWHAGYTANHRYLGVELCETPLKEQFDQSIQNLLDVLEEIFRAYAWPTDYADPANEAHHFFSHNQTSLLFHETSHTDPTGYFAGHGYSMQMLQDALHARLTTPAV